MAQALLKPVIVTGYSSSSDDEEIEVAADRFTALLEPLMIVGLACVVGYIVFAIVQPILEIGKL